MDGFDSFRIQGVLTYIADNGAETFLLFFRRHGKLRAEQVPQQAALEMVLVSGIP